MPPLTTSLLGREGRRRERVGHPSQTSWYAAQFSRSVVSYSLRPHESQHARPPCPSPTPGVHSDSCPLQAEATRDHHHFKDGSNCFSWSQCLKVKVLVTLLCQTLCHPLDCSPPGSSVHGILQGRTLEWVAIPFSRDLPKLRDKSIFPALQADSLPAEPPRSQRERL